MEMVLFLLVALAVLHYTVVFYVTMARRAVVWMICLTAFRSAGTGQGDPAGAASTTGLPPGS